MMCPFKFKYYTQFSTAHPEMAQLTLMCPFKTVQFKMVSMHLEKPIQALRPVSQKFL